MNIAVYTAIYGGYEATVKPLPVDLPCAGFLFTDQPRLAEQALHAGWCAVVREPPRFVVDPANGDPAITVPMLKHKWFKTHPVQAVPEVEASIWLDGNMQIKVGGVEFVDRCLAALGDDDWSSMRHPWRNCIYVEAEYTATVCAYRYSPEAIRRQAAAYEAAGWPREAGLPATGFIVRRHTPLVAAVGEAWWQENLTWSHQDQISLPYVIAHALPGPADDLLGNPGLRVNYNLPWGELWELLPHGS